MRLLALVLAAAVLAAGCLDAAPTATSGSPSGDAGPAPDAPTRTLGEEPTFCATEEGCTFWDEDYHEYVLYDVDTPVLDVLVVPSASADTFDDTPVLRAAVDAWAAGVQDLGADWFASGFRVNVYVLGEDAPPAEAIEDPEIVVLGAEYNPFLLFGIGLEPQQFGCGALGEETVRAWPEHAHSGGAVYASDCAAAGFLCFAVNTNFLTGSAVELQDLVAHEVGHCLGGGHVGDALDFSAKYVPVQDIMSYQHADAVHCVSDLNVRVLEALYAPLLGADVATPLAAGDFYTMPRADYAHVACGAPQGT